MQYQVQDPQGNMRVIEGPDGASDEEVIAQAQKLFGHSGGMPSQDPIDAFKAALANHPARPNPQAASFNADINQTPESTNPIEQRLLQNATTAASGYGIGALLGTGLAKAGSMIGNAVNASKLAPASALEEGLAAKDALSSETAASKAVANKLYDAIPKDVKAPLTQAQSTADSIINEIKTLPKSFQSSKIMSLVGDVQNLDEAPIGTIQAMRSALGDMAVNGEGVEKLYAARLSKALASDVENFGKAAVLDPSKFVAPAMEGTGPTSKFIEGADAAGPNPYLTNSDIPNKLNQANSFYKDLSQLQNHPVAQALNRAKPEEMAAQVFRRGNVDDVNVAKAVLGDTGFKAVQRQFYESILHKKDIPGYLAKYSSDFIQSALTPQMKSALDAVALMKKAAIATGGAAVGGTLFEAYRGLRGH